MNLAARLEGMCKQYGVEVLISGAMYRRVEGAFLAQPLDRVVAAGKSQAADIYELVAERKGAVLALKRRCAAFAEVVAAYSARDFAGALLRAAAYEAAEGPDMAAAKYVARCRVFLESPPPDGLGLCRGAHVQVGDTAAARVVLPRLQRSRRRRRGLAALRVGRAPPAGPFRAPTFGWCLPRPLRVPARVTGLHHH